MVYPWQVLSSWQPFRIDALGIVTLLGAEELGASIGRLAPSRWLEHMPLLAGFVFASDRFRKKQSSYQLYNITSGIMTSDLAAWFTRWMQAQEFEVTRSLVWWDIVEEPRRWWSYHLISGAISFALTGFLVVIAVLSDDWYGFANAVATVVSIVVRGYLLQTNRTGIDRAVQNAAAHPETFQSALKEWQKHENDPNRQNHTKPEEDRRPDGRKWRPEQAKSLIVMPDARAVTMFIPEKLIVPVFAKNITPHSDEFYHLVRWVGWIAFAVHVVAIGMSKLATQLYIIAIMVIPTVLICLGFGCEDSKLQKEYHKLFRKEDSFSYVIWVGSHLRATVFEWPKDVEFTREGKEGFRMVDSSEPISRRKRSTKRQDLYAWLNLNEEEIKSFETWQLLPHSRGHDNSWDEDFKSKQKLIKNNSPDIRLLKEKILSDLEQMSRTTNIFKFALSYKQDIEQGISNEVK